LNLWDFLAVSEATIPFFRDKVTLFVRGASLASLIATSHVRWRRAAASVPKVKHAEGRVFVAFILGKN
jgi:hypothetical protein